ncbi:MAG: [FeFe] hydrogenase H-cluster radical SAM maturase HydG [Nitrospirota bacterium]|nr:[FeFe] hydrogenase H-cluster radical SAM maturase HydG [Nitrospirota bacterium]
MELTINRAPVDHRLLDDILARAQALAGLSVEEAARLLTIDEPESLNKLFNTARTVKEAVFGRRVVLFAPLYLSNSCTNNCLYCGFRIDNREQGSVRRTLSVDEAVHEARLLEQKGYKRLLLVLGEDRSASDLSYLRTVVEAIYSQTGIRILHLNAAPMTVEEFREIKAMGVGVYQCFQETYHEPTYRRMHPSGKKADFQWRIEAMDRAMEGGFGDVGMGALLGLYDYRFEVASLIAHARHLEARFGVGPHTISVPRLQPAAGAALDRAPSPVSDAEFKKIVAVYRLAIPYAGVVISTREPAALRDEVIEIGASQLSAGSSTEPGGYGDHDRSASQFEVEDHRSIDEMVKVIAEKGWLPSLCTACYRSGRTGDHFRELAEEGDIKQFCLPNALLTLQEYALDSATPETAELCNRIIAREGGSLAASLREGFMKKLGRIKAGERDIFY